MMNFWTAPDRPRPDGIWRVEVYIRKQALKGDNFTMAISVGDSLPTVGSLARMTADGPGPVSVDELFGGKKVVLFALPGAFTPTCSASHLPGYVEKAAELKSKGIDDIVCMSVRLTMSSLWTRGARQIMLTASQW